MYYSMYYMNPVPHWLPPSSRFGVHPRFAHMVLRGAELEAPELAALLAALLSERDILRGTEAAARLVCGRASLMATDENTP